MREYGAFSRVNVSAERLEAVDEFEAYPRSSPRRAALQLGISRTTIRRVLKVVNKHPYHFTPTQHLPVDFQKKARILSLDHKRGCDSEPTNFMDR